jgi:lipoate-protein ligase A
MITLKDLGVTDIEFVKKTLRSGFESALGITTREGVLTKDELQMTDRLLGKYLDHEWTYKMDIKRAMRKSSSAPLPQ